MQVFSKYFAFLMVALGLSAQCFAVQNLNIISENSQSCDNYYVQPGGVYVAPNGIFVSMEGSMVQVSTLCGDERGIFVPYEEMSRRFVRCPHCGGWYDPEHPENHKCKGY